MSTPILTGRNLIAGQWRPADGTAFDSRSPAHNDEVVGRFPASSPEEVRLAVASARASYPLWRRESRIHRAELFDNLAQLVKRDADDLARLMARECGKVVSECRAEVIEGLHMIQYVFGTGRWPIGDVLASEIAEKDAFMRRKPWGVVAVITPWNFPFAVPLWMLGPSLLEGNTAVFKPSEDTPAVGQRLVELFVEAGFPPGVLNLVHGAAEAGEAARPRPRRQRRPLHRQLRGRQAHSGSFRLLLRPHHRLRDGQQERRHRLRRRPPRPGRQLRPHQRLQDQRPTLRLRRPDHRRGADLRRFAGKLVDAASRLRIGDPLDAGNFTGPVIHKAAVEKVLSYNDLARKEGGTVLLDGGRLTDGGRGAGCYLSPFVYRMEHRPGVRSIREEVFGPHLALIPFKTNEEAVKIYNDTEYGLSMAVVTEDYRAMRDFRDECEYGMGYVNLPCIGAEVHLPFGGVKKSGNGHPSAAGLVEAVTHKTAWTVNHGLEVKMAQGLTTDVAGGPP